MTSKPIDSATTRTVTDLPQPGGPEQDIRQHDSHTCAHEQQDGERRVCMMLPGLLELCRYAADAQAAEWLQGMPCTGTRTIVCLSAHTDYPAATVLPACAKRHTCTKADRCLPHL